MWLSAKCVHSQVCLLFPPNVSSFRSTCRVILKNVIPNCVLCGVADAISANIPKSSGVDCIKLVALIVDEEEDFNLRFPVSYEFLSVVVGGGWLESEFNN